MPSTPMTICRIMAITISTLLPFRSFFCHRLKPIIRIRMNTSPQKPEPSLKTNGFSSCPSQFSYSITSGLITLLKKLVKTNTNSTSSIMSKTISMILTAFFFIKNTPLNAFNYFIYNSGVRNVAKKLKGRLI